MAGAPFSEGQLNPPHGFRDMDSLLPLIAKGGGPLGHEPARYQEIPGIQITFSVVTACFTSCMDSPLESTAAKSSDENVTTAPA